MMRSLQKANAYFQQLKPECIEIKISYEESDAARKAEKISYEERVVARS